MAFTVLESSAVPIGGSTTSLVKRSLTALARLLDPLLGRGEGPSHHRRARPRFSSRRFHCRRKEHRVARRQCERVRTCHAGGGRPLSIAGNLDHLLAALVNLPLNSFKFTHPRTEVTLQAYAEGDRVHIDLQGHCGGLPAGFAEKMFKPFTPGGFDRSGLGLGLSIARRTLEKELPSWTGLSQRTPPKSVLDISCHSAIKAECRQSV